MARRFQVSEPAMHWRLYNLKLVEERPEPARLSEEGRP
jgi:hypothetical protein